MGIDSGDSTQVRAQGAKGTSGRGRRRRHLRQVLATHCLSVPRAYISADTPRDTTTRTEVSRIRREYQRESYREMWLLQCLHRHFNSPKQTWLCRSHSDHREARLVLRWRSWCGQGEARDLTPTVVVPVKFYAVPCISDRPLAILEVVSPAQTAQTHHRYVSAGCCARRVHSEFVRGAATASWLRWRSPKISVTPQKKHFILYRPVIAPVTVHRHADVCCCSKAGACGYPNPKVSTQLMLEHRVPCKHVWPCYTHPHVQTCFAKCSYHDCNMFGPVKLCFSA